MLWGRENDIYYFDDKRFLLTGLSPNIPFRVRPVSAYHQHKSIDTLHVTDEVNPSFASAAT